MPSHQHEVLLLLFQNRPQLAAELLREVLHAEPPPYAKARIGSAELSEIDPVQYQADLVVILEDEAPVLGIVVEVQLAPDKDKRFVWPVYATNLRARLNENRRHLYFDLIWASLSEVARRELQMIDPSKSKYEYQSAPARRWFADGQVEGRAALVSRLLAVRYGPLSDEVQEGIRAASIAELDAIGERLLTASTLHEALGQR